MAHLSFSCYIIGSSSLTLHCAQLLQQAGHRIQGMISQHPAIQSWAKAQNIVTRDSIVWLENQPMADYLFSIVNEHILPQTILKKARYFAINFHDAPLSRYAGVHATSWAILNGEIEHGTSWHLMVEALDAGDTLKQARIPIAEDETAFSLNLKCYEQAKILFAELIEELAAHHYTLIPQDLSQRSYYGRYHPLPNNGFIDWQAPAAHISCLVLALQFGNQPNRIGTAKLIWHKAIYVLEELKVTYIHSQETAGKIMGLSDQALQVATGTTDILITKLSHYDGEPCVITDLYQFLLIERKQQYLESPHASLNSAFEKLHKTLIKSEAFWIRQLTHIYPLEFPNLSRTQIAHQEAANNFNKRLVTEINITDNLLKSLSKQYPNNTRQELLLSVLLIYFYRGTQQNELTVSFTYPELVTATRGLKDFFSTTLPLSFVFNQQWNFQTTLENITQRMIEIKRNGTFLKDISLRYPQFQGKSSALPIEILFANSGHVLPETLKSSLSISIPIDGQQLTFYIKKSINDRLLEDILSKTQDHFANLLRAVVSNAQQPITTLSFLREREKQTILIEWNRTEVPFPQTKTIHQLFEEQAVKSPNRVALICDDQSLTYCELNTQANRLASYLHCIGIKNEDPVILCIDRNFSMVIGMLGILKAGGAYVPIDSSYPLSRIKDIIDDVKPFAIATEHSIFKRIFARQNATNYDDFILIDKLMKAEFRYKSLPFSTHVTSESLAYILYTSGSTGKQKGVLISHLGVVNCIKAIQGCAKIKSIDKFIGITSLSFDVAALDYYLPLSLGATTIIANNKAQKDTSHLIKLINKYCITVMQATPGTYEMFRLLDWKTKYSIKMLVAGEALPYQLAIFLEKNGALYNIYGPTEATIYTTLTAIRKNSRITIGKPIANTQVYVLDKNLQPLPIGFAGELHIGGVGLARGYLNRPELTAEKFIPHPFSKEPSARLYKTGDLVRWLPEGELEYLGRLDHQVKIRGFRIELGEVEQALLQHPDIAQAVVIADSLEAGHQQLIAYVVAHTKVPPVQTFTSNQLQTFLNNLLPDYMVPAIFVALKALPLNANGKVDRQALLVVKDQALPMASIYRAPESVLEKHLVSIFEQVLKKSPIGIQDDFFALGGDSILAMQVIVRAHQQYGYVFSVETIFKSCTVARLVQAMASEENRACVPEEDLQTIPLTPIQQWFFEQELSAPEQWSQVCFVKTTQALDKDILKQAMETLITEHDAFNFYYYKNKRAWQQGLRQDTANALIFECVELTAPMPEKQLIAEWGQALQARFDLTAGPLIAVVLFYNPDPAIRRGDSKGGDSKGGDSKGGDSKAQTQNNQLLIVIHHLLVDGVSWRILLGRLTSLYQNALAHLPIPPKPQAASFVTWARALQRLADSDKLTEDQAYWEQWPAQWKPLPVDDTRGENTENSSQILEFQLDTDTTHALLGPIHSVYQTRINEVLLAALLKIMVPWLQSETLVFDLESHGRQDSWVGVTSIQTLGWFTSLFPVALTLPSMDEPDDWGLLLHVVKQQLRSIPHQGFGYGILRYLSRNRRLRHLLAKQSRPQLAFNYWGQFEQALADSSLLQWGSVGLLAGPDNHRSHLINLDCMIRDGCFTVVWTYSKHFHNTTTIACLGENYQRALTELVQHCVSCHAALHPVTPLQSTYPLTPLQQGLLFQYLRRPRADNYQIQLHWHIQQALDLSAMQRACQALLDRYAVLRTSFVWEGVNEPMQVVHEKLQLPWTFYDGRGLTAAQQSTKWTDLLLTDRQTPLDLKVPPLWRVTLLQLSDTHYRMLWRMYHILLDGWSVAILLAELEKNYHRYVAGQMPIHLSPEPFSDYVQWVRHYEWSSERTFWQSYLKGFMEPTDLMLIYSANALANNRDALSAAFTHRDLSLEQSREARQFAKSQRITLNTLFQALWGILLYRCGQSDDIVFGTTVSGRSAPLANMAERVGLFINTLPLRMRFTSTSTVSEVLCQLQQDLIHLLEYGHSPLAHVQSWSEVHHSQQGLFESIVVFENYPQSNQIDFCSDLQFWDPTHYALTVILVPQEEIIQIKIGYDAHRFTEESIQQILHLMQRLLLVMVQNPQQAVSQLALLSMAERRQLLTLHPSLNPVPQQTLIQSFEAQVLKKPGRWALSFQKQHISYQVLNARANQLARHFMTLGIGPDVPVALCLPRSLELIIGLLAVWKAGGVYVPLDPDYPIARLKIMLTISGIKHLVTHSTIFEKIEGQHYFTGDNTLVLLDQQQDQIEPYSCDNPDTVSDLDDLAYILYTSGTTGQPKAVAQVHQTLANLAQWQNKVGRPQTHCNITQFAAMSFDVSLQEITYSLANGHHLHIVAPHIKQSLSAFLRFLEAKQIQQLFLPTALLEPFCEAGLIKKYQLGYLTHIFVSGEALKISPAIQEFFMRYPHVRLTNQYGPTETHVASSYVLPADSRNWPHLVPIGVPIDHTLLYVLDKHQQLLPHGVPGELYIGGLGVAYHYIGDAEKTNERFIRNPFKGALHARLYRTGDKVCRRADGQMEYLGRLDEQVKIRGFRIEPAEIEAKILERSIVRECRVFAKLDPGQNRQLIAYLLAYPNAEKKLEKSITMLQQKLASVLPEYMLPAHYVVLKEFPLTAHGKIDPGLLPEPPWASVSKADIQPSARHVFDRELSMLWMQVLGTAPHGIHANFFSSGGNSLNALRLILAIEKQFDVQLNVNDLFLSPTLAKLSDKIQQLQANALLTPAETVHYKNQLLPSPIMPLQTNGCKKPLFIIHPVGGTVFWFVDLARHLGSERPVYGIQDPGVMNQQNVFDSIEAMAAFYLHCIRQIQPQGPYLIAGASFGATVAFEIARQLEEQGERADFVGLLDGWAFYPKATRDQDQFKQLMRQQCEELYERFQIHQLENADRWVDLQWQRNALLWKYSLIPLDTPLTLFKASELNPQVGWAERPDNYWSDYSTQALTIIPVPGDHASIFNEPNVKVLAQSMNACLKKIETNKLKGVLSCP